MLATDFAQKLKCPYMFDFLLLICIFSILNSLLISWVKKGQKKANEGLKKALKAKYGYTFFMKIICTAVKDILVKSLYLYIEAIKN